MKKIAIMQPYFMPYLGYISLIKHTDEFIIFDTPQFMRHGWIERNRILKQDTGWMYIKVPLVKSPRETPINKMLIDNSQDWKSKIKSQLQIYKKSAPFYEPVMSMVDKLFEQDYTSIAELNMKSLQAICDYLGIEHHIHMFSEMNLDIVQPTAPDEWALNISLALKDIDEYWNPPGGIEFFDRKKYEDQDIKLVFQKPILSEYNQRRDIFEPGLSIVDVMMFNSPEEINQMLDNYETE